ncbi:deoxyribonuclease-2-alpha [Ornithorhynchus anatinus]|uniref:deoxyribonuclease-2-alpha n=1 Tax=Ornithorhynchus anatinus TaxID=9258 RepID=UPI000155560B|nr:deoxyribonuclease-2-alpha [Ornithorhynchus anatinus]XP_007657537.1 deoxyribonuclease-2-alpha [Ornithorhynchus anatinus]
MVILLLLAAMLPGAATVISCYGDTGKPVDWFAVYKLPELPDSRARSGMSYMYLDGKTEGWREGTGLINSTQGAVGRTLQPLYRGNASQCDGLAFLLYNDQPPKGSGVKDKASRGHTKGVLLLDKDGGFWMIHSTPHFPPPASTTYSWPDTARPKGQSFLCVSFSYSQFQEIGKQLAYTFPLVYNYSVEGTFAQDLPELLAASQGHHVKSAPWNRSVALTSSSGEVFFSFAKFGAFADDLYSGWLASALGSDLDVQFWPNSPGVLPSNCSGPFRVLNVVHTAFPPPAGPTFSATLDHSKWCVAARGPWTCVGDMNRNQGEEHRGGGILCSRLPALWKAFQPLVQKCQPC